MGTNETSVEARVEQVPLLNAILEGVISDASDLVRDLSWGVKTYLLFGLISILFGVQELVYNIDLLQVRLYIPLLIAGAMIFAVSAQIIAEYAFARLSIHSCMYVHSRPCSASSR